MEDIAIKSAALAAGMNGCSSVLTEHLNGPFICFCVNMMDN